MADVQISTNESQEDLVSFFTGSNDLLEQLDSDADNFVTEYLERGVDKTWARAHGLAHGLPYGLRYDMGYLILMILQSHNNFWRDF